MNAHVSKPVAKYRISRRIGRGGMAEVFLAIQEGVGGFEKLVVVKRIFPKFCNDDHFVSMFLQEARLAASIRHPNVVHINDIEQDEDGYFLVMEYLAGESLAYIWEALRTRKQRMPPNLVCRIGSAIAAGLHHAHIATDAAGNPQPIVHRDVTPSNLLVCYNGIVKIVDFGVAKATLSEEGQTRAGALKGKMSYLAPEQIRDEPVDGRTDVFQLGICLHEMLTGRRLFKGKGDHAKMSAILDKEIVRPSDVNPRVPRLLDDVVLRALARDKDERHQSAEELRSDLDAVLLELGSAVSASEVGAWMRESFEERYNERLDIERESVAAARDGRSQAGSKSGLSMVAKTPNDSQASHSQALRTPTMATVLEHPSQSNAMTGVSSRRLGWVVALGVLLIGATSLVAWRMGNGEATASKQSIDDVPLAPTVVQLSDSANESESLDGDSIGPPIALTPTVIRVAATPKNATIYVDSLKIGVGEGSTELRLGETVRTLIVQAPGYVTKKVKFSDQPPPFVVRLAAERKTKNLASNSSKPDANSKAVDNKSSLERKHDKPKSGEKNTPTVTGNKPDKPKTDPLLNGNTDNVDPFAD